MQTITDKLEIEKLLSRLTTYIAMELHLSTMAEVGAVYMSKVANELSAGKKAFLIQVSVCARVHKIKGQLIVFLSHRRIQSGVIWHSHIPFNFP